MSTNTFAYSLETLAEMELMHEDEKFMKADDKELLYVAEADDPGEERTVFGFGPCCPIELKDGVDMCKSFKLKHNCCSSVVSESLARNYLAKHIFDSSNHPTHGDKKASFKAANDEPIVCTTETSEDRKTHRNHSGNAIRLRMRSAGGIVIEIVTDVVRGVLAAVPQEVQKAVASRRKVKVEFLRVR